MENVKPELNQRELALILRGIHQMIHVYATLGMDATAILLPVHEVLAATDEALTNRNVIPSPEDFTDEGDEMGALLFAVTREADPNFPTPEDAEARLREALDQFKSAAEADAEVEAEVPGTGFYL